MCVVARIIASYRKNNMDDVEFGFFVIKMSHTISKKCCS